MFFQTSCLPTQTGYTFDMENTDYNYRNFKAKYYNFDAFPGPKPGEKAVDFSAQKLSGDEVRLSDYFGRPIVMEAGSITCPVFCGKVGKMNELAQKYPEVNFLVLYVREAHPGVKIGPHASLEEKTEVAKRLKEELQDNREILVDDVDGTAHTMYGLFPDSIYIIDKDSTVIYRAVWNNIRHVDEILESLQKGIKPRMRESHRFINAPMPSLGRFAYGGYDAVIDFIKAFPGLILERFKKKNGKN